MLAKPRRILVPPKPISTGFSRENDLEGGRNWERCLTEVLRSEILPFCKQIVEKYGKCYLVEDGAAAWRMGI